jgi:tetratricopeptide (TPR) repeat protein
VVESQRQLAECYLETRNFDQALATCREALQYAQRIGDRTRAGIIHRVLGKVFHQQQNLASAIEHLDQSIAILGELNQDFDLGAALFDYAQVLRESGQIQPARVRLLEASAIFERLQLAQEQAKVKVVLDQLNNPN